MIAESNDTIVVEGNHYFPFNSIKKEYFHKTEQTTLCGWKGMANYYSISVNG
ncbi:MAG: DUF427 domain-containing protein, partial [Nitrosopumilus sp.]|nr:DUF427 domain-containing protein [Nitrosopumilus sp.]